MYQQLSLTKKDSAALMLSMRHLALLLSSGLNLVVAVTVLIAQQQRRNVRQSLVVWHRLLQTGVSIQQAAQQQDYRWPPSLLGYLAIGEQTGQLPKALNYAVDEFEQARQHQQLLWKATRYPLLISLFALLISAALLIWVLPQFTALFGQQQLPWLTQQLLALAYWLEQLWLPTSAILLILGSGLLIVRLRYRNHWQSLLLHLPVLGPLLELARMQQLFLRLSLSLQVGMPALQAIQQVRDASHWHRCQQQLTHIHQCISDGASWAQACDIISTQHALAQAYIATGEQSGLLDSMLQSLAQDLHTQLQARTSAWLNKAEPLLMLVLGGIIGTLLLAMYLPIFTLGQQLN